MAIASQLFRLDQLDSAIARQEAALADIRRRLQHNPEADAAEAQRTMAQDRVDAVTAEQRRLEADLADLHSRIKRDNTRMYSGQIVDPRELASLERELHHHTTQRDALEERILALMESGEALQVQLRALEERVAGFHQRHDTDRTSLQQEGRGLLKSLADLRAERIAAVASLDAPTISTYERARKTRGQAVSEVVNGVCQLCRIALPPKDVQHARAGALVTCSNCGRILYSS